MTPTDEQVEAIRLFKTGGNLAIEAGAGTGKTSTLVLLSQEAGGRRGQYVAFNKALVTDAGSKFGAGVATNTAHSLAYRAHGYQYRHRLNGPRMTGRELGDRLRLPWIDTTDFQDKRKTLSPGYLGGIVRQALRLFSQSADPEVTVRHFPLIRGLDLPGAYEKNQAIREQLLPFVREVWRDLLDPSGWAPYEHEHYLKQWQLSGPRIPADYILFDEAQDANPVIAAIVAAQQHAQLIYVGDSQQEIYGWTGAINALAKVEVEHRTFLTQSFRFGQRVADVANDVLQRLNAELTLTGNPAIDSSVGTVLHPHAILTRTNATGIARLMSLQALGLRPHFMGGSTDVLSFAKAAGELQATGYTPHPDLTMFKDWNAVRDYVAHDEDGADLELMVRLVDTFGTEKIIAALQQMPPEDQAEIVISTAHKSKGREWLTIQLAEDFNAHGKELGPTDLRLLYVAVTRAKERLDVSNLDPETLDWGTTGPDEQSESETPVSTEPARRTDPPHLTKVKWSDVIREVVDG